MSAFQSVVSRTTTNTNKAREAGLASLVDNKAPVDGILSGIVDLNELTVDERLGLIRGPKVSIMMSGKVIIQNVPVRAFMAISTKANAYFRRMPQCKPVDLPVGRATHEALKHVLKSTVTDEAIGDAEVFRIPGGHSVQDIIQLYKAGVTLGMSSHVDHVVRFLRLAISRELISYHNLTTIVTLHATDPLFLHVANDLARRRFQHDIGTAHDEVEFAHYLKKHQNLKLAMDGIDKQHANARKYTERMVTRATEREQYEQEKKADFEYNARVCTLTKKLNQAKGGVVSLTHEDGELRHELGIYMTP
ncbi:hypothetical protein PMIN06_007998 [Paraphaeosphaeria minitans]|uniref:Uncharacterized protein n=1 Tax=Paraphaeosphaeria minitans TaxID=565426 RepID=A0A9P6GXC0_9PLEO|nr:hypothetical protein PMIN01_01428 [Paraphaeosphaeria minitans]